MTDDVVTAPIAFHIELTGDADAAGRVAGALRTGLADVPGVSAVDAWTDRSRFPDPATAVATIALAVTLVRESGDLVAAIDRLIGEVRKLTATLGLGRVEVEVGRRSVDASTVHAADVAANFVSEPE